jgi:ATP-binding cassette subfamily C protein CydD
MKFSKKLLHYIPGIYGYVAATVLIGLLAGTILILQNYLLSMIIAGVFLARQSLPQVWPLLLLFIMLVLIRVIMTIGNALCAHAIARQLKLHLRERLLARICKLGPTYLSNERSGELVSTMTEGIEALDPYFSQYLPQVFLAILLPALMLITIFIIDVPSGIILLIMVPMLPFLLAIVGIMAKKETERHWKMLSLMSAHFLDMLQGLTTLKLLGRSEAEVEPDDNGHTEDRVLLLTGTGRRRDYQYSDHRG